MQHTLSHNLHSNMYINGINSDILHYTANTPCSHEVNGQTEKLNNAHLQFHLAK